MLSRISQFRPLYRQLLNKVPARQPALIQTTTQKRLESTYAAPDASVNLAYKEAVSVIEASKQKTLEQAQQIKERIGKLQSQDHKSPELASLNEQLDKLLIKAYINDSEVLWNAKNNKFDLDQPVYRYLKEKLWRERPLEVLMQRITQMYIVPDAIDPDTFGTPSTKLDLILDNWNEGLPIEPGSVIPPELTTKPPTLNLTTFHKETKFYTIIMADLDDPNEEAQTYREKCHWMVCNVPADMYSNELKFTDTILPYVPPHPAKGTKRHRYAFIVMEQGNSGKERLENVKLDRIVRIRQLTKELGLRPVGVSFFRSEWNSTVDDVYREHLGVTPPNYAPPPKATRFDEGTEGFQKKQKGKYNSC